MDIEMKELYGRIDRLTGISRGFQGAAVLAAGVECGIFDFLDKKPADPALAARELGLDPRAVDIVLHALAGMGLLELEDGLFRNSPLADELLVRGRAHYQGDIIGHSARLIRRWVQLPSVLRTGKPAAGPRSTDDRESRKDFILGMSNIARLSARKIAEVIDLGSARRMLDLGGGPGTYAITFCSINPGLTAVVFDLPEVIDEITTGQVAAAGLGERISFIRGDYLENDYGRDYDLVLVSNIIHSLGEPRIREMLGRCRRSMVPGGRVVVKDFLLDDDRVHPAFGSMFAVNMLVGTEAGGCYTVSEIAVWLGDAGFGQVELREISPQARLLVAVRP
ncbi:MAG: methyltransferase domain-containing protein [Candidatus Glassbacteria bacterium]|nr:methyltransferase domain-containing protein [Candidatus Glassbacteria bacterium]